MEVKPVEENPNFLEDAAEAIKGAKGVIIACSEGYVYPVHPPFGHYPRLFTGIIFLLTTFL
jgi:hypothetical protein